MTMHTANGHDEAADLPALAAGTLTPEARTRAEAHLAGCAACRAELAAWHAVTAATGHLAEAVAEPSPDVLAGALARIEPRTPARRPRRWAVRVPRAWIAVGSPPASPSPWSWSPGPARSRPVHPSCSRPDRASGA